MRTVCAFRSRPASNDEGTFDRTFAERTLRPIRSCLRRGRLPEATGSKARGPNACVWNTPWPDLEGLVPRFLRTVHLRALHHGFLPVHPTFHLPRAFLSFPLVTVRGLPPPSSETLRRPTRVSEPRENILRKGRGRFVGRFRSAFVRDASTSFPCCAFALPVAWEGRSTRRWPSSKAHPSDASHKACTWKRSPRLQRKSWPRTWSTG